MCLIDECTESEWLFWFEIFGFLHAEISALVENMYIRSVLKHMLDRFYNRSNMH